MELSNTNTNVSSVVPFNVKILFCDKLNEQITQMIAEHDVKRYEDLAKQANVPKGEAIEFFSKWKSYPVLGNVYQYNSSVSLPKRVWLMLFGKKPIVNNAEMRFLIVPDNYGFIRHIGLYDVKVASYGLPYKLRNITDG